MWQSHNWGGWTKDGSRLSHIEYGGKLKTHTNSERERAQITSILDTVLNCRKNGETWMEKVNVTWVNKIC